MRRTGFPSPLRYRAYGQDIFGIINWPHYNISVSAPTDYYRPWLFSMARANLLLRQHTHAARSTLQPQFNFGAFPLVTYFSSRKAEFDLSAMGGCEAIKDSFEEVICYLKSPEHFKKHDLKPPKGIILSGPPGVGKTAMVEAVAGTAGVELFMLSASEFEARHNGESEEKIRKLFEQASNSAPCVICIDEIDSVGQRRETENNNYRVATTNQLLSSLSQNHPGVVVFATTNNYDTLDPALVRPGRFDRHIAFSLPECSEREQILSVLTKKKKLHGAVSLFVLASLTEGFSGAQLNAFVNEAGLAAWRGKAPKIGMEHFDDARSTMVLGKKRTAILDPALCKRIATHEVGHALVGVELGLKLYKVVLNGNGATKGYAEWLSDSESDLQRKSLDTICMLLAARASEELSEIVGFGSSSDIKQAKKIAAHMAAEGMLGTISGLNAADEIELLFQAQKKRARDMLEVHRKERDLLIEMLSQRGELSENDIHWVLKHKTLPEAIKPKEIVQPALSDAGIFAESTHRAKKSTTRKSALTYQQFSLN